MKRQALLPLLLTSCSLFQTKWAVGVILEVSTDQAPDQMMRLVTGDLVEQLLESKIACRARTKDGSSELKCESSRDLTAAREIIERSYSSVSFMITNEAHTAAVLTLPPAALKEIRRTALEQATKVLRQRADALDVDIMVQRYSATTLAVTLPALDDPERTLSILTRRGYLEFRLADDAATSFLGELTIPATDPVKLHTQLHDRGGEAVVREHYLVGPTRKAIEAVVGKTPANRELFFGPLESGDMRTYLLHPFPVLTGDYVVDARALRDPNVGTFDVVVTLDEPGAKLFATVTGNHVRERLAIILDGTVNSAPLIQERIAGGTVRITLGRADSVDTEEREARDLALILKASAYPVAVSIRSIDNIAQ